MNSFRLPWKRCLHTSLTSISKEKQIITSLETVIEPVMNRGIVQAGCLKQLKVKEGNVQLTLDFLIPGYPYFHKIRSQCEAVIRGFEWVKDTDVIMDNSYCYPNSTKDSGLTKVKHVIVVSSCKGGVGKSTIAVSLARAFARKFLKVGLLDGDVYGPSVHLMLPVESNVVRKSTSNAKFVVPLTSSEFGNLRLLSFGHVNSKAGVVGAGGKEAAVIRGPVASKVINQLIHSTDWGELDYLIVDMPPGTGDIPITICQSIILSGSVIVSTPHDLAIADTIKGIKMFEDLRVSTLLAVENFSYFDCQHGERYYPFGKGSKEKMLNAISGNSLDVRQLDFDFHSLPLLDNPSGHTTLTSESSDLEFDVMCEKILKQLFQIQQKATMIPSVTYSDKRNAIILRYFHPSKVEEFVIPCIELRKRNPADGRIIANNSLSHKLEVTKIDIKGKYGVSFVWNDGYYQDIFPYETLKEIGKLFVSSNVAYSIE